MIVEVNALCFAFCVDKCINAQVQSEDLKSLSLSNFIQYKAIMYMYWEINSIFVIELHNYWETLLRQVYWYCACQSIYVEQRTFNRKYEDATSIHLPPWHKLSCLSNNICSIFWLLDRTLTLWANYGLTCFWGFHCLVLLYSYVPCLGCLPYLV